MFVLCSMMHGLEPKSFREPRRPKVTTVLQAHTSRRDDRVALREPTRSRVMTVSRRATMVRRRERDSPWPAIQNEAATAPVLDAAILQQELAAKFGPGGPFGAVSFPSAQPCPAEPERRSARQSATSDNVKRFFARMAKARAAAQHIGACFDEARSEARVMQNSCIESMSCKRYRPGEKPIRPAALARSGLFYRGFPRKGCAFWEVIINKD